MVEKCCFLFSRVSHRDPKVEPAGLGSGAALPGSGAEVEPAGFGSGAKVQSPATLLWGLTPASTPASTLLWGLTPVCTYSIL